MLRLLGATLLVSRNLSSTCSAGISGLYEAEQLFLRSGGAYLIWSLCVTYKETVMPASEYLSFEDVPALNLRLEQG